MWKIRQKMLFFEFDDFVPGQFCSQISALLHKLNVELYVLTTGVLKLDKVRNCTRSHPEIFEVVHILVVSVIFLLHFLPNVPHLLA